MEHFGTNKVLMTVTVRHSFKGDTAVCIMFICVTDLPLKLSYPPDFSESRHYGLLLVVYVPFVFEVIASTRSAF